MIFYTDRFVPDGHAGCARGPFIFIRPQHKGDAGLLAHEKVHVRQWWRTLGLHSLRYLFSRRYRLKAEVEAYREQLKHSPGNEAVYAVLITARYGLNITITEAYTALGEKHGSE